MDELQGTIEGLLDKGWTISALADELGNTRVTVSRWRTGEQAPSNVKGILMLLHALEQKKRIPKQRRYATPRKGRGPAPG